LARFFIVIVIATEIGAALRAVIRVAAVCHNVGCDLLAVNDASSAMEFFSVALKLLEEVRVDPHFNVDLAKLVTQSHDQVRLLMTSVHPRSCDDEATFVLGNHVCSSSHSVCAVQLLLPTVFISTNNSTILLYNMGLACLAHGAPPTLHKSLSLFDMALQTGNQCRFGWYK
jgi:hypothetical protein